MSRLLNIRISNEMYEKLKLESFGESRISKPITMTQIVKEGLDMWFKQKGKKGKLHGKNK